MAGRPTIKDVADTAGVSVATVDRVLNGRSIVRHETKRRVADAAHRLGYHARSLIDLRLDEDLPQITFGFVLHKEKQTFFQNFKAEIEAAVKDRTDVRGRCVIRFATSQTPDDFTTQMRKVADHCDVMAASSINHPTVDRAVEELTRDGKQVFALLNDFAAGTRQVYFGMNNMQVGRVAAWMLGTAVRNQGKFAVFVGGNRWHGHQLRETGFRSYLREHLPGSPVLDTLVNLETRQVTYEATLDLLSRHEMAGIYVAGGGMEGAIAALREARPPGKVALVVNELTPESRAALADGYVTMVISTPLRALCRTLIDHMIHVQLEGALRTPGQVFLEPRIYLPESV
jgi:LacI family transcriptional regulator